MCVSLTSFLLNCVWQWYADKAQESGNAAAQATLQLQNLEMDEPRWTNKNIQKYLSGEPAEVNALKAFHDAAVKNAAQRAMKEEEQKSVVERPKEEELVVERPKEMSSEEPKKETGPQTTTMHFENKAYTVKDGLVQVGNGNGLRDCIRCKQAGGWQNCRIGAHKNLTTPN